MTLDIEADVATNGNDINLANDTYGQPGGDITNARNIFMEANVGHIGSNTNRVGQIWAEFLYTINIYAETHSQGTLANNKPPVSGTAFSGGIRLQNLPTVEPVGTGTSTHGVLWNSGGFLKVAGPSGS